MSKIGGALLSVAVVLLLTEAFCSPRLARADDTDLKDLYAVPQNMTKFRVVKVVDGDTLWLEGLGRVRLVGIDAPESVHPSRPIEPCGLAAAHEVWRLLHGRQVGVEIPSRGGRDFYGRMLAYVWYRQDVGRHLLLLGLARVERRFPFDKRAQYEAAERVAKGLKRGVWGERQCVPPIPPR